MGKGKGRARFGGHQGARAWGEGGQNDARRGRDTFLLESIVWTWRKLDSTGIPYFM